MNTFVMNSTPNLCPICKKDVGDLKREPYFVVLSIESQLKELMQSKCSCSFLGNKIMTQVDMKNNIRPNDPFAEKNSYNTLEKQTRESHTNTLVAYIRQCESACGFVLVHVT